MAWRLVLLLLLALALRLPGLGGESFTMDEGFSLRDARDTVDYNRCRPLYYLLLSGWMRLGEGEAWLRLPSVAFGVASVGLLHLVTRWLAGERVAWLASLLMALSAGEIERSRAVRMYALGSFLVLLAIASLLGADRRCRLVHFAACWLALLTTPLTALPIAATAALALVFERGRRHALALGYAAVLAAWTPWILDLPAALAHQRASAWLQPEPWHRVLTLASRLLTGLAAGTSPRPLVLVFHAVTAVLILAACLRGRHARGVLAWAAFPAAVLFSYSLLVEPVFLPRYLAATAPGFCLLVALGLDRLSPPSLRLAATTFILGALASFATAYLLLAEHQDWRAAARLARGLARPGDVLALASTDDPRPVWRVYDGPAAKLLALRPAAGEPVSPESIAALLDRAPASPGRALVVVVDTPRLRAQGFDAAFATAARRAGVRHRPHPYAGLTVHQLRR